VDTSLLFKYLLPTSVVGAVLGKGGATVNAIKRSTGAYVQFTRPGTATNSPKDRMMIIAVDSSEGTAAAVQTVVAAMQMILAAVEAEGALDKLCTKQFAPDRYFLQQVIPAACAGKVMGPGGEDIKMLSQRTGCSVIIEGKSPNAAFVPFRLVNYLAIGPVEMAAAVAEVAELVCQEEKYDAGGCPGAASALVLCCCLPACLKETLAAAAGSASQPVAHQSQQQPYSAGACPPASVPTPLRPCPALPFPAMPCPPYAAGIRELCSVCFRIVEIPDRKVGAVLGPNGAHIKNLQEVLRCKMGVADGSSKPGSRFVR
jgi:transcription antitermination factor NusA-like protein